jgi:hypothetical protein
VTALSDFPQKERVQSMGFFDEAPAPQPYHSGTMECWYRSRPLVRPSPEQDLGRRGAHRSVSFRRAAASFLKEGSTSSPDASVERRGVSRNSSDAGLVAPNAWIRCKPRDQKATFPPRGTRQSMAAYDPMNGVGRPATRLNLHKLCVRTSG